jgi:hypothetical protein
MPEISLSESGWRIGVSAQAFGQLSGDRLKGLQFRFASFLPKNMDEIVNRAIEAPICYRVSRSIQERKL